MLRRQPEPEAPLARRNDGFALPAFKLEGFKRETQYEKSNFRDRTAGGPSL